MGGQSLSTIVRFGTEIPELTSANWLNTLGRIPEALRSGGSGSIEIDLSQVRWIGHLPLLALCLGIEEVAHASFKERKILMPGKSEKVRAFLDRWNFYKLVEKLGFLYDLPGDHGTYGDAMARTRVLPIRAFEKTEDAAELRDAFHETGTALRKLLTKDAFLTDRQIAGLADLIIYELCQNAVEHAEKRRRAFIMGRVSKHDDAARAVYESHAATWESAFFTAIRDESMTELVIGDAGVGIVGSLREQALAKKIGDDPQKILRWAFEPFSTRKRDSRQHTRGLWAVKNKVRELRGLLYVRSGVQNGNQISGISASWDFYNEPDREVPQIRRDPVPFAGTQVQILLPHRKRDDRQAFFDVRTPRLSEKGRALIQQAIQIPVAPVKHLGLRTAIERLGDRDVLFVDLSQMDDKAWDRIAIDEIGKEIYEAQGVWNKRVWLLNPSAHVLDALQVSRFVERLWEEQALLLPVVKLTEIGKNPVVQYVNRDTAVRSRHEGPKDVDRGDTVRARELIVQLISNAVNAADPIDLENLPSDLTRDEYGWLTSALGRNSALVELSEGNSILQAALDVEALARLAVGGVLRQTVESAIRRRTQEQERGQRVLYRLPSLRYCGEYIDPRILSDLDSAARAAVEKWTEDAVKLTGARYAVSYSFFAVDQLTRALRTESVQAIRPLRHYSAEYVEQQINHIPSGATAVLLVPISGSGYTIVQTAKMLQRRKIRLTVVCLIDTMTDDERALLRDIEQRGDFRVLVHHPIPKWNQNQIPDELRGLPVAVIDPETLLPIIPVPVLAPRLTDGEFWQLVAKSRALGGAVTYKGIAYTTLFWMRNLLNRKRVIDLIIGDLRACFATPEEEATVPETETTVPHIICLPRETSDATTGDFRAALEAEFPQPQTQVIPEEEFRKMKRDMEKGGKRAALKGDFEGKNVAIIVAAASSGSGIARLLTFFKTAKRIHLSIFINRIPNGITSAFAPPGGKVTITSFQRVYTASPDLRVGNAQSIAIPALADYRASCVSNRLLLYVDGLLKRMREEMRSAETPQELAGVSKSFNPPTHLRFEKGSYALTPAGLEDLQRLVSQSVRVDRPWLYAVLEEAAAHAEVDDYNLERPLNDADWREYYIEYLQKLYVLAPTDDMTARSTILEAMILDRWRWHKRTKRKVGELEKPGKRASSLARDLLTDIERTTDPAFRSIAIRAIAKLDRLLLTDRVDQFLDLVREHRDTELTFSLEITKILDDDAIPTRLLNQLTRVVSDRGRRPGAHREDAFGVALSDLFQDVGLYETPDRTVEFQPWEQVAQVLRDEPPDHDRTIRALIRAMRGRFGPDARFLYYREVEKGLYAYADAWPRRRITEGRAIREANLKAVELLGDQDQFYTPQFDRDRRRAVKEFLKSLKPRDKKELMRWGMALFRFTAEGKTGFLRVWQEVTPDSALNAEAVEAMPKAIEEAVALINRPPSAVSGFGEWQYEQTLKSLRQPSERSLNETLGAFTDRVRLLFGGNIATLLAFDEERQVWSRRHVSGRFAVTDAPEFGPNDDRYLTTIVARQRAPRIFPDCATANAKGFLNDPAKPPAPWIEAWLAFPLIDPTAECTAVIHVWHHIPGWFEPRATEDVISALSLLGASMQSLHRAYAKARKAPRFDFTHIELDRLTRRLINHLLTAQALVMKAEHERTKNDDLATLLLVVQQAQDDLRRFLDFADHAVTELAEGSLREVIESVVHEAKKRYTERRFELKVDPTLPPMKLDFPIMGRAVEELLRNAKRHSAPGAPVEIDVIHDGGNPGSVRLEVRNRGYGVPNDMKAAIFERSGLLLVKAAAERHGGTVEEVGTPGENAAFRMTLPIRS